MLLRLTPHEMPGHERPITSRCSRREPHHHSRRFRMLGVRLARLSVVPLDGGRKIAPRAFRSKA